MKKDVCQRCIQDFHTRSNDGNPKKEMDPNLYGFIFEDDSTYSWSYWWERGILHHCIHVVPAYQPIGVGKAMELVPGCPFKLEHTVGGQDGSQ